MSFRLMVFERGFDPHSLPIPEHRPASIGMPAFFRTVREVAGEAVWWRWPSRCSVGPGTVTIIREEQEKQQPALSVCSVTTIGLDIGLW